LTSELLL